MGKFDGYLLLSDFDGTLAYSEKELLADGTKVYQKAISRENCDAIRYFQSEGGLFTLATGRQFTFVKKWEDHVIPNTYLCALNGAHLYDVRSDHTLFSRPMDEGFIGLAERILTACPALTETRFTTLGGSIEIKQGDPILLPADDPVYKMVFVTPKEHSTEYSQRIASLIGDRYVSMRSWINGIEVLMQGATKGDAVKRLKTALGERARTVVAVGDYENDLDMIRAADIGYAVENAVDTLKAAADRVTVSCKQSAIAKIIEELGS